MFLSLLFDVDRVFVARWAIGPKGIPEIFERREERIVKDSWDDRMLAVTSAVSALHLPLSPHPQKVVLGFPSVYLTQEDDIDPSIRPHIKTLARTLHLQPIGFVPLHQAILYNNKTEEGIPPSVILIGLEKNQLVVSLYKIGILVGKNIIPLSDDPALSLERNLKQYTDIEILPSRMLLYGERDTVREDIKDRLLRHQWTTRANFVHFPKIEVVSSQTLIDAICLAGASELATMITEDEVETNITVVRPEDLGFSPQDHPERPRKETHISSHSPLKSASNTSYAFIQSMMSSVPHRINSFWKKFLSSTVKRHLRFSMGMWMGVALGCVAVAGGVALLFWFLPHANMILYVIPKTLDTSLSLTIDPKATLLNKEKLIIPGHIQEKTIHGEHTMPATGKKKVGDPSRGKVTIFNKSLSSKTFRKGTILSTKSVLFTLDDEIMVASASENLTSGTITYGKSDGSLTASDIGPEGNMPAGTEFTIKDVGSAIAVARNTGTFTGGSSHDVTVVSRLDYDAIIKAIEDDLVGKSKNELAEVVTGGEKLIEETIATKVVDKTFTEELGQEAQEVHGKATITVSGISYTDADLRALFIGSFGDLPQGYVIDEEKAKTTLQLKQKKKDGTYNAVGQFTAVAFPSIDRDQIRSRVRGKKIIAVQEYLQSVVGIGGVGIDFQMSPLKDRLPIRASNISITVNEE